VLGFGESLSGRPTVGVSGAGASWAAAAASALIGAGGPAALGSAGGSDGAEADDELVDVVDDVDEIADNDAEAATRACASGGASPTARASRRPSAGDGDEAPSMVGAGL